MKTYGLLREKIRRKFKRLGDFAEFIGLDRSSFSKKLNSRAAWTSDEIEKICNALDIPMSQVDEYFFYE